MSESKHTKGPWELQGLQGKLRIVGPKRPFETNGVTAEDYANAYLIAAAPDLLEACKILDRLWLLTFL